MLFHICKISNKNYKLITFTTLVVSGLKCHDKCNDVSIFIAATRLKFQYKKREIRNKVTAQLGRAAEKENLCLEQNITGQDSCVGTVIV